ncbi:MAG: lytic murein transglycosylase [Planktomarina sp.]
MFEDWKTDFLARSGFPAELANLLVYLEVPGVADSTQAEARKTLKQYLNRTVTDTRITKGRELLTMNFDAIPAPIDPAMLLAIWGMETNFGAVLGDQPVFGALATLAANGRRRAMFEDQLMAAADMVAAGISPDRMIGSWAGAMGHTQFMPRSYQSLAVSLGRGLPDIWDDSMDALASSANYLHHHGAHRDMPWGAQIGLLDDLKTARHAGYQPLVDWGFEVDLPAGDYRFLLPSGSDGPAFLVSKTYDAVLAYNNADAYALAVCHLSDRIKGSAAWDGPWPADERGLSVAELAAVQKTLTGLGFDTHGTDGFTGPNTIKAVEAYQDAQGLPVDGFAGMALAKQLGA